MKHMIDGYLETIRKQKKETSKSLGGFPSKIEDLEGYILKNRILTEPDYAQLLEKVFSDLGKKMECMAILSIEEGLRNSALAFWNTEKENIIKEINDYLHLPMKEQFDSWFHRTALGFWKAWVEDYIHEPLIVKLSKCINKQIIHTGHLPKFESDEKNTGGALFTVDKVNVLMTYIDSGANGKETSRRINMDPSDVRGHLKAIIGVDYRKILEIDHTYYAISQIAYGYWLNDPKNRGGG